MFEFIKTTMQNLTVITPKYVTDERGSINKFFEQQVFAEHGVSFHCFEAMESRSSHGVLRGMHQQKNHPQAKLVRVVSGEIFDVAVDLRPQSPTFGQWEGFILSGENRQMLYLPRGFAHGFLVLSPQAVFSYLCDAPYFPEDEQGICWNDPALGIKWPLERVEQVILSPKDQNYPPFVPQKEVFV